MGAVAVQLDKLAKAKNCRNSSGIGELLHVSRSTISQWRSGTTYPEEDRIALMARMAHEDAAVWLAEVRAERATGEAGTAWRDAVRRLSMAAVIAEDVNELPSMHYAKCWGLARFLIRSCFPKDELSFA